MSFANQPGNFWLTYTTLPRSVIVNRELLTPFSSSGIHPAHLNSTAKTIEEQECLDARPV